MLHRNSSAGTAAKQSSKCLLIQRPAIILAMLLLCAVFVQAQAKYDTTRVIMLVSDTSDQNTITTDYDTFVKACDSCMMTYKQNVTTYKEHGSYWKSGFIVRKFIPAGWGDFDRQIFEHWEFYQYLDVMKWNIPKSWIVWQSVSAK